MAAGKIAGEDPCDPAVLIERDVQVEGHSNAFGDAAHGVVYGVALRHAPGRLRMADAGRGMQLQHRGQMCQARRDHLRAAREAGEEVGLDETRRQPYVVLQKVPLEQHWNVRPWHQPQFGMPSTVERVMLDHPRTSLHFLAEHLEQLLRGAWAVRARGDEHGHASWVEVL